MGASIMNRDNRVKNWKEKMPRRKFIDVLFTKPKKELIIAPINRQVRSNKNRKKTWRSATFLENFFLVAERMYLSFIVPWFLRTNRKEKTAKIGAYVYNTKSLSWYIRPKKEQNKTYATKEKTISLRLYVQNGVCLFKFIKASINYLIIPKPAENLKPKVIKGV